METLHPEGDSPSPFAVSDDASIAAVLNEDIQYANCPVENCGEILLLKELDSHIEMHGAEANEGGTGRRSVALEDGQRPAFQNKISKGLRNSDDQDTHLALQSAFSQPSAKAAWKQILKMPESKSAPKPKGVKKQLGVSHCLLL